MQRKLNLLVLGIETSCDETGVALFSSRDGLVADKLYSQVEVHSEFGGVVPELASRDHIRKLAPMVKSLLEEADLEGHQIDGVAFTAGPGLAGSLLVGSAFARSLAWAWGVPALGVNHMEGHLLSPMLETDCPEFPFVALLVSCGHTQLIEVEKVGKYKLLGESIDDAAGEAFDKVAKILGLGYPGGPRLAKAAINGDPKRFHFPRPMINKSNLDFSFSGLKTHTARVIELESKDLGEKELLNLKSDVARAFEEAVVDILTNKCIRALNQTNCKTLIMAGGVSANSRLRMNMDRISDKEQIKVIYPRIEFCTDNGAMIAYAGWHRLRLGQKNDLSFHIRPRWPITEIPEI